jgi:decaprenyl-phosphate phosphoribosyltransferase
MLVADSTAHRPRPGADFLLLLRPLHVAKSLLLVPVALIDTPGWSLPELTRVGWAALTFSLAAASVYIGNDLADRECDRLHPVKSRRPIASGRISVRAGRFSGACLLVALAGLVAFAPGGPYWPVLAYLALNVAYTRFLKRIPLIDVCAVAFGFVLRIVQGYVSLDTRASEWLLVAVFSVSLLMLIGKRRAELLEAGADHRPALRGYSIELTNQLLPLTGVLAVTAGLIYLGTEARFGQYQHIAVLVSAPFGLFALFRYLQVLLVNGGGADPVRALLRDPVMVATVGLWGGSLAATLLLARGALP